jgi:hypothetical protein
MKFPAMAVKTRCRDVLRQTASVQQSLDRLSELDNDSEADPDFLVRQVDRLMKGITASTASARSSIQDLLGQIDGILERRTELAESRWHVPSIRDLRAEFQRFISAKQPLIPAPYAPLCGAYPQAGDTVIPNGSFVCARNPHAEDEETAVILAYVFGFDPETSQYHVVDADPELERLADIEVDIDLVVPMPTSVPARRTKQTTHGFKSTVLSLWKDEDDTWTTVFYWATVSSVPPNSPGSYGLKFDGNPPRPATVPERFVVAPPKKYLLSETSE